jgi:hypothetical protein
LRDPAKAKEEALSAVLESSSRQLDQAKKNIEEIKSIAHWAKSPRERTAINIVLDDQKKVARALARLVNDLSEICSQPV